MEVTHLSKTYNVRRLQEDDIEQICTLCSGNPQYYRYHPPAVTADSIREDMRALPPGREPQDKYYVGYFAGDGTLLAVMDLILGYPQEWTAFIGFFMVSAARQGTGLGFCTGRRSKRISARAGLYSTAAGRGQGEPTEPRVLDKERVYAGGRGSLHHHGARDINNAVHQRGVPTFWNDIKKLSDFSNRNQIALFL